ncbi:GSCOCG00012066001-RA-CDS [Cotesia congregata]|nr:GSCOCG00012066001-RA-CDS [Cotesia congregata]
MYLVALCKEKLFDHTKVFGKIIQDIKDIETDGIEISPGKVVKGSLVFVTGDNLGSHGLGGFTENFSKTQYFCRYCLVTKKSHETANGVFKHDIFEGVLAYDLKLYLDDLVDKGWFSYKLLNH